MVRLVRIKKIILFLLIFFSASVLFAQVPSQKEQLRVQIWSEMDAFPGDLDENVGDGSAVQKVPKVSSSGMYDFAVARAKKIAPFLLSGMISGWTFDYVPYDKTRRISEEFEFQEVIPYSGNVNPITYKNPVVEDDRLLCWAYCDRTESQQLAYRRWNAIAHPKYLFLIILFRIPSFDFLYLKKSSIITLSSAITSLLCTTQLQSYFSKQFNTSSTLFLFQISS